MTQELVPVFNGQPIQKSLEKLAEETRAAREEWEMAAATNTNGLDELQRARLSVRSDRALSKFTRLKMDLQDRVAEEEGV